MTEADNKFTRETANTTNPTLETAVDEIRSSLSKQNKLVLDTARLIKRHANIFPGLQKELAEQLDIDKTTFNKYLRIADCGMFYTEQYQTMLPAGLSLLYELSLIKYLDDAFRNGVIRPDLTRAEIKNLREYYSIARTFEDGTAPSIQPNLADTTTAPVKTGELRSKAPKIPADMCAMIKVPDNFEQQEVIFEALNLMRAADVVVYDQYTRDNETQSKAIARWTKMRDRLATQEIRRRLKKARKEFKPSTGRTFASVVGSPDELIPDGTVEGAKKISEYIEEGPEFAQALADIDDQLGGPDMTTKIPVFNSQTGDPRQALKDLGLVKEPKQRDFSGLNFDK